jgi:hypothetical protein
MITETKKKKHSVGVTNQASEPDFQPKLSLATRQPHSPI